MKIIFIVDDNETNLEAARLVLEERYKVYAMTSAARMFKMLEKITPELIVLDLDMPEMTGYEAQEKLKNNAKTADIPVIFLTAISKHDDVVKGLKAGVARYIIKPYHPQLLLDGVKQALQKKLQAPKVIFVVDDNETNLETARLALGEKYKVHAMTSAARMFQLIERIKPDLILLDLDMPEMTGYEAQEKLKNNAKTADIPVIFLTAISKHDDVVKGLKTGVARYIIKPYHAQLLISGVQQALKNKTIG